jgi:hypothetical protein
MQINAGMERIISVFEDGWASGAMLERFCTPSYVEPALRAYWQDGYRAALEDHGRFADALVTTH